ncbi:unnamed protein product, partial [Diplocarpon coronariae]
TRERVSTADLPDHGGQALQHGDAAFEPRGERWLRSQEGAVVAKGARTGPFDSQQSRLSGRQSCTSGRPGQVTAEAAMGEMEREATDTRSADRCPGQPGLLSWSPDAPNQQTARPTARPSRPAHRSNAHDASSRVHLGTLGTRHPGASVVCHHDLLDGKVLSDTRRNAPAHAGEMPGGFPNVRLSSIPRLPRPESEDASPARGPALSCGALSPFVPTLFSSTSRHEGPETRLLPGSRAQRYRAAGKEKTSRGKFSS